MKCPLCKFSETKVLDTRLIDHGQRTRRRRQCPRCEQRFTTYEYADITMPTVCKKDGRREDFNQEKLSRGLEKACQKLPISKQQLDRMIESIKLELLEQNHREIQAREIGTIVMKHLKALNPVAYVRFASVYKRFHDLEEFYLELKNHQASGTQEISPTVNH